MLEIRDLCVNYGPIVAVNKLNLTVEAGQMVALIGTNGAGKTSTLKAITNSVSSRSGEVYFEGQLINKIPTERLPRMGRISVPEGRGIFPNLSVEENLLAMTKAADNVSTGQITYAARNSDFDGHQIEEGQILALDNNKLSFVDTDVKHAVVKLCKNLINARRLSGKETSFITMLYGDEITEEQAEEMSAAVTAKIGNDIDITVINGGQPVYYFIFSVE